MNNFYKTLIALFLGVLIGGISALQALSTGWGIDVVKTNQWRNYNNLAEANLSAYAKAYLANNGHLPLPNEQALYYFTYNDADGKLLKTNCSYTIEGSPLDVYWWSISTHDQDFKKFENPSKQYSFNMTNILRQNDGHYKINIGPDIKTGNWLPIQPDNVQQSDSFVISFRLYGLNKTIDSNKSVLKLPIVKQTECK